MAKSVKQQMYEQLANQHVQQALNNIGMQQFQEAYNQWNAEQEGLANFQAAYNAWNEANPLQTPEPVQQVAQPVAAPVVQPKQSVPVLEKTKVAAPTMEDYFRQQQEESMLQSANKDKGQKYKDAVNAGRDVLFSKEADQLKKQNAVNNLLSKGQQSKPIIGANVSQVDLSKYNLPESNGLTAEEIKNFNDLEKAKQWTQEGYKLTKEEAKEAQRIARENIARLEKPTEKTSSPAYFGRRYEDMTPEEQAEYDLYKNLDLRSNKLKSFAVGAADKLLDYGKTILAGNAETQARKLSAEAEARNALGLNSVASPEELRQIEGETKENIQNVEEQVAPVRDLAQGAPVIAQPTLPVIGQVDITPYGAGQFTTQALAYGATNPAFDAFGAAMGGGKVAGFIANQIGQNAQDLVLDTSLVARQALEDGVITPEEEQAIQDNIRSNGIGNAFFGGLQEIPALAKFVNGKFKANNAADEAFRANVRAGADKLAELARPADDVVESATKQADDAAQRIEELAKQIPADDIKLDDSEMKNLLGGMEPAEPQKYIPSAEELRELEREANTMDEIEDYSNIWKSDVDTKGLRPYAKNQGVSPSIENAAEELSKQMDVPEHLGGKVVAEDTGIPKGTPEPETVEAPIVNNTQIDSKALRKETNNMKTSFREKIRFLRDKENPYAKAFLEKVDDFTTNPNANTYSEMVSAHEDYIQNYRKDIWHKGANGPYKPEYHSEQITKRLDDIAEKYGLKNSAENTNKFTRSIADADNVVESVAKNEPDKVMAESVTNRPKAEPEGAEIEGKWEIEDTPENAPIDIGPEGEIDIPEEMAERGLSKHIRNDGTPMRMEDVAEEVAADFEKDPDLYKRLRNADTKAKAEQIYNTSDNPEADFRSLLEKKDPAALPLGHQLAKDYSAAGNHDAAAQIYRDMGKALTESGQFSQAAIINMVKNDPMTALQFAQKEIDGLNAAGKAQFGDGWKDFKLTEDELKAFKGVKAGDSDAIKSIYENIGSRLGKEYPTTIWDKVIEARRVAMLFNPRTNVRNLFANPPTLGMRWLSDRVEAVGQNVAHIINPEIEVTQSLYGSGLKGRKLAKEAFESPRVKALRGGSGSKSDIPNLKSSIMKQKQVFKGTAPEKWIDRVTNGGIQRLNEKLFGIKGVQSIPETIRNGTYKLLDLGDSPFVEENFIERLGSYISAQGIKNVDDIPDAAIDLAWEEAMKATYKDNSWAVQGIKKLKGAMEDVGNGVTPGLGTAISQSTIPFVQAPGNIAARMVDYSPVGAGKGIAHIIAGARKGDLKSVQKGIEETAKGLTGTGLIALGMKLKEAGIITGTYSNDKDQKAFEKMNGFKEFAFRVGDKYFTYGWAQPWAQTMMVGTLLQDAIDKSDEYDSDILRYFGHEGTTAGKAIGVAREGVKTAVNSWFNESPLQNFAELLKGNSYEKTDIAGNLWENGVSDFAGAMIPSVVNATAKVVDPVQRNTYNPDNAFASFVDANKAKIPGLSKTLPAKYDTWGEEMRYAETSGGAALAKYLVPGEYSYNKSDEVDAEINRLFNEAVGSDGKLLQDNGVFPLVAPNKVGDKTLNNREVSEYQKDMGQRSRKAAEAFMNSDAYKSMGDPERVEVLKKIYGTSNVLTKRDKFDTPLPDNSQYKKAVAAYDEAGGGEKGAEAIVDYYTNKMKADESGLDSQSKAYEEIQKDLASGNAQAAQQKIDDAKVITDAGINNYGYKAYEANKTRIPDVQKWTEEYKSIDSLGNSDGFVNQNEFLDWVKKNNYSEDNAVKYSKIYGDWKQIPYLKKDGTWGFHKQK